jgi:hypothetical protein
VSRKEDESSGSILPLPFLAAWLGVWFARALQQQVDACRELNPQGEARRPQVVAKNKWARIEALLRNRSFIEKYRDAFLTHLAGLWKIA